MRIKFVITIILICFSNNLFSQEFKYKSLDGINNYYEESLSSRTNIQNTIFLKGKKLLEYLPSGYDKKGNVDYTTYLQKGIDENSIVILPNFPILISPRGLKLKSDSKLFFQINSQLIIKTNNQSSYHGLLLEGIANVEIYYANIKGDRETHTGNKGQWGMGIWIDNSNNVTIKSPKITNCWGDGIYIGNKNKKNSSNIQITNGWLDNNRRNGVSIVSGDSIIVSNSIISNSNGQNPQSGIDVEPNNKYDVNRRITLNNIITYNNALHGIILSTGNLSGNTKDKISIEINNHTDYYSTIGLGISVTRDKEDQLPLLTGNIIIKNSKYISPKKIYLKNYKGKASNVKLILENININNKANSKVKTDLIQFQKGFNQNTETTIR